MHLFSVYFFVTSFILTRMFQNPSNKNKDDVELKFYSVVTCLSQFYIMYFSQVCMH